MSIVTLSTAKEYMGVTSTGSDVLIQTLLDLVEGEIEAYIDRTLAEATYSDEVLHFRFSRFDGGNNRGLSTNESYPDVFLKNYPVTELTSITSKGDAIDADTYTYDANTGTITFTRFYDDCDQKLKVNYVAGYTVGTLPKALEGLILEGVKASYQRSGTTSQNSADVQSKKIGDFSVTYADGDSNVNIGVASTYLKKYIAENQRIIRRYERISI